MEETDYIKAVNQHPDILQLNVLKQLSSQANALLLSISKIRTFSSGEVITRENEFDPWVYILMEGALNVLVCSEQVAQIKQRGEFFGEMVLIEAAERSATLVAQTETKCLAIDAVLLEEFQEQDKAIVLSQLYRIFSKTLAHRLKEADHEISLLKKELNHLT